MDLLDLLLDLSQHVEKDVVDLQLGLQQTESRES